MYSKIEEELLKVTSDLHQVPAGAYNIRKNGESVARQSSKNIEITTNEKNNGLVIKIKKNTTNESVHIPVIISQAGITEIVTNEIYVGDNSDVTIVAGCGIHTTQNKTTEHSGIHKFVLGKNAKVRYVERHVGSGSKANKIMNPKTELVLGESSEFNMETVQLGGVSKSNRQTVAVLEKNSKLIVNEKILTEGKNTAESGFVVHLNGKNSSSHIVSRAVSKDDSTQIFNSIINGNNVCFGHTECDAIIVGNGKVLSCPAVNAVHPESSLVHEAAIGKIAGEQILKLMTLGLTEEEAQNQILKGFLK